MSDDDSDKRSWLDFGLDKARKALEVGSEAADVLVHLQNGATPVGLVAVGLRVINSIREHRASTPAEYFGKGWIALDLGALERNVYQSLVADQSALIAEVPGIYEHRSAVIVTLDDLSVGFALFDAEGRHGIETQGCWIPEGQSRAESVSRLGRSVWETLKSSKAVLSPEASEETTSLKIVAAEDDKLFPSIKGDELYGRMKQFLDKGYHRSVFVLGDPGVGKTELLKYIASLHGGFLLRIQLGDLDKINGGTIARVAEILRPSVLIIDDFDRFIMGEHGYNERGRVNADAAALLDPVERINKTVPLFMVSANFSEEITEAMLRPERFDEVGVIRELDPDIYARLLPDAPPKVIAELKRLKAPIAYVEELRKRVEVLGYPEAAKEMRSLLKRAKIVLQLNKKHGKGKGKRPSLVGLSPRRRASALERRAFYAERSAGRLVDKAEKQALVAEEFRKKAKAEREKADTREAKSKESRAKKKSKTKKRKKK